jgi:tetratricopeptide (TPR) repeat protein
MRPTGPKLDKYGFPIPQDFEATGLDNPSGGPSSTGPWIRRLLKLAVVGVVASALWVHFDLGTTFGKLAGQYHAQQAVAAAQRGDWDGALVQAERALSWSPTSIELLLLRAKIYLQRDDYERALNDVESAVVQKPNDQEAQSLRLLCLHRLHRQREAAAAATDILQRSLGNRTEMLNTRAYARALGDFDLDDALIDIEEALAGNEDNASFLDTRGYVLFKLGRHDDALADFDRAIELVGRERDEFERTIEGRRLSESQAAAKARRERLFDENLAVMHHHRGEVYEKLGRSDEAKKDLFIGQELGFDPAAGVY